MRGNFCDFVSVAQPASRAEREKSPACVRRRVRLLQSQPSTTAKFTRRKCGVDCRCCSRLCELLSAITCHSQRIMSRSQYFAEIFCPLQSQTRRHMATYHTRRPTLSTVVYTIRSAYVLPAHSHRPNTRAEHSASRTPQPPPGACVAHSCLLFYVFACCTSPTAVRQQLTITSATKHAIDRVVFYMYDTTQ